jgi:hypothetical protein
VFVYLKDLKLSHFLDFFNCHFLDLTYIYIDPHKQVDHGSIRVQQAINGNPTKVIVSFLFSISYFHIKK